MFFPQQVKVFLFSGFTDMRKSIQALSLLVEDSIPEELFQGSVFAFCSKNQRQIKLLYWEENGFCLWMKRLEQDRFSWPKVDTRQVVFSSKQLTWLLDGFDFQTQTNHRKLKYKNLS